MGYPDAPFSGRILALYETEIADMPQVFLPFATDAKGQTLEEKIWRGSVLGEGTSAPCMLIASCNYA